MPLRTVGRALANVDEAEQPRRLTPELRESLEIIDTTQIPAPETRGSTPRAPERVDVGEAAGALGRSEQIAGFKTGARGQALREGAERLGERVTSAGRAVGRGVRAAGEFAGTPGGQILLGTMGEHLSGIPSRAVQIGEARAVQNMAGRLLAGEPIEEISGPDVAGISPEGVAQAQQMVEQERVAGIEDRRVRVQERTARLQERGFEADERMRQLQERETELGLEMAELELDAFETVHEADQRVTIARAGLMEAQMEALEKESGGQELSPQERQTLLNRTQDYMTTVAGQIETLIEERRHAHSRLDTAQRELATAKRGWFGREVEAPEEYDTAVESASTAVEELDTTIKDLQTQLQEAEKQQMERLGVPTTNEGEDSSGEGEGAPATPEETEEPEPTPPEGTTTGDGTISRPLNFDALSEDDFINQAQQMKPGTYAIRGGRILYMNEEGELEF